MVIRKVPIVTNEVYHVFSKSIAGYRIFNNENEFSRIKQLLNYYRYEKPKIRFSWFINANYKKRNEASMSSKPLVQLIAYCFMQTHFHVVAKQLVDGGMSRFMSNILNSYARYFNLRHKRRGPLWEGAFKNVHVKNDNQLLHLTRYIHLNPTTASLVSKPEAWKYSSYIEYISNINAEDRICDYNDLLDIKPKTYKEFVDDNLGYQRDLHKIKKLIIE